MGELADRTRTLILEMSPEMTDQPHYEREAEHLHAMIADREQRCTDLGTLLHEQFAKVADLQRQLQIAPATNGETPLILDNEQSERAILEANARADAALAAAAHVLQTGGHMVMMAPLKNTYVTVGDRLEIRFTIDPVLQAYRGQLYIAVIAPSHPASNPELLERASIMLAEQYLAEKAKTG